MSAGKFAVMILGCVAAVGGSVNLVHAQACMDDSGCPKGFSCEITATSGCAVPTPAPASGARAYCGDAGPCASPPSDRPVPACDPQEYRSCVPVDCVSDGDCADGMVCHARSTGTCASAPIPPCAPGSKCPDVGPPICTDTVEQICIPRYLLPCEQAKDCGDGFTCEPQSVCGCSAGSAGTGAPTPASNPSAGAAPPPAQDGGQAEPSEDRAPALPAPDAGAPLPPDCKCEPTKEKYCKVIEIACRADVECPKSFKCANNSGTGTGSGPACFVPPGGNGDAGACGAALVAPPSYRCVPPYENIDTGYGGKGEQSTTPTTMPGNPTTTTVPPVARPVPGQAVDAGVPVEPGADNAGSAPSHVKACSVVNPGESRGTGSASLWTALMSLVAAWVFTRRAR